MTEEDEGQETGRDEQNQSRPPKIPSLKGKIHAITGAMGGAQTSKSGIRTDAAMTAITGLSTHEDKSLLPHGNDLAKSNSNVAGLSRTGYGASVMNV